MKVVEVLVPFDFHRYLSGISDSETTVKYIVGKKKPVLVLEKELYEGKYPNKELFQFQIYEIF